MQIKRYFAPDMRQAMRLVREDLGPEAVILSNRKVDGGVEIVAAPEFPRQESLPTIQPAQTEVPRADAKATPASVKNSSSESIAERLAITYAMHPETVKAVATASAAGPKLPLRETVSTLKARKQAKDDPSRERAPAQPGASESARALSDLHKEVRLMRRLIDQHLSESTWCGQSSRSPARLDVLRRMSELGFTKSIALRYAEKLGSVEDLTRVTEQCQTLLRRELPMQSDDLLETGGVIALVGPTGVGKTTTIAKLAARYRLKHGPRHVVLVTTDGYRIGAHEQLQTYGRILDVPVRVAANAEELKDVLAACYDKRLVLVDTTGVGQRDARLAEQAMLFEGIASLRVFLVLSAASQARALRDTVQAFRGFQPTGCILTKLDETALLGTALSAVLECRLPLAYWCDGQQVPEDLHRAQAEALLRRCFAELEGVNANVKPGNFEFDDWVAQANV